MDHPNGALAGAPPAQGELAATRRGIRERLADPWMTDHDRWVLRQFDRFLSGIAPEPDPRAAASRRRCIAAPADLAILRRSA